MSGKPKMYVAPWITCHGSGIKRYLKCGRNVSEMCPYKGSQRGRKGVGADTSGVGFDYIG